MRSVVLYFLLVGVPVLGVLGMLRLGERIVATPAVGGTWQVEGGALCAVPERTFRVEQSGTFLRVLLPGRVGLPARLARGMLSADGGARSDISPGCRNGDVRLRARVGAGVPDRIEGMVGVPGCAGCPMAAFAAVRVPADPDTEPAR